VAETGVPLGAGETGALSDVLRLAGVELLATGRGGDVAVVAGVRNAGLQQHAASGVPARLPELSHSWRVVLTPATGLDGWSGGASVATYADDGGTVHGVAYRTLLGAFEVVRVHAAGARISERAL